MVSFLAVTSLIELYLENVVITMSLSSSSVAFEVIRQLDTMKNNWILLALVFKCD